MAVRIAVAMRLIVATPSAWFRAAPINCGFPMVMGGCRSMGRGAQLDAESLCQESWPKSSAISVELQARQACTLLHRGRGPRGLAGVESWPKSSEISVALQARQTCTLLRRGPSRGLSALVRSEEHTSELQSRG